KGGKGMVGAVRNVPVLAHEKLLSSHRRPTLFRRLTGAPPIWPHSLRENEVAAGVGCLVGGRLAVSNLEMIVEPPLAVRADLDQAGALRRGPDILLRRKAARQAFAFLEQRKRHLSPPDQNPPTMAMPKAASGSCAGSGTDSNTWQTPTLGRLQHLADSNTWQIQTLGRF